MKSDKIGSYPSVVRLGSREVEGIFNGVVIVQEKIDGSQFSFGIDKDGNLKMRSKNVEITQENHQGMFAKAVEWCVANKDKLNPWFVYRGEYLQSPKHNNIRYERVPKGNIIIFDISCDGNTWLEYDSMVEEAHRIGLECVPEYAKGKITKEFVEANKDGWLSRESVLGGGVEGFVIKNYAVLTPSNDVAMAKVVREDFREIGKSNRRIKNAGEGFEWFDDKYVTEARWNKAYQHLKEQELIQGNMSDVGRLIKEVNVDVLKECTEDIKEDLFKIYWKRLAKRLSNGLAEWYDNKLNEPDEDDDEDFLKDVPYVSFSNEEIRNMKEDHPFYKYIKHLKE